MHRFSKFGKRSVKKKKPSIQPFKRWRILKGDHVYVIEGRERGKDGIVLDILRKKNRVVVAGCNMVKRRMAPNAQFKGGLISREAPMHVSNINLVDPASIDSDTGPQPTKVGIRFMQDGSKERYAKRSGVAIPKPEDAGKSAEVAEAGPKDTDVDDVVETTFEGMDADTQLFDYLNERDTDV